MDTHCGVPRIVAPAGASPIDGTVHWSPVNSMWLGSMTLVTLIFGPFTLAWDTAALFFASCGLTLCLGHSLGMHRRLVHNSYDCPLWLEYFFIYCGTLVGMAGPLTMVRTHDTRDWAQRQPQCHDYFAHRQSFWVDAWWQLHCKMTLVRPPVFAPEARIANDKFYKFLERTWMLQQLPVALALYFAGGWAWVVWGVCARVATCVTGHWLVGHFAHRQGHQTYLVDDAGVQGHNIGLGGLGGLITMGECWHNNHHAFPGSAKLGLHAGQHDIGWWVLCLLQKIGLVRNLRLPSNLPPRSQVRVVHQNSNDKTGYELSTSPRN